MKRHAAMNRIYRLVWSQVANAWVAVAETTRGKGKAGRAAGRTALSTRRQLAATALSLLNLLPLAQAAPTGGAIVAGSGTGSINQSGATTTVTQDSAKLSVNWATFNVAANETVNFVQPSASALAVNRIYDANGSQILGRINANGQLYLINPNGILFGAGSQVNVGGLVASTLDLSAESLAGNTRTFRGNGGGKVENRGTITAAPGGYVAFLGNQVSNQGVISAKLGTVALGGGSAATLTFDGNKLLKLQIDASVLDSLAENGGLIHADGGSVLMSAGAADSLLASVVNNTGIIEARSVDQQSGTIVLLGGMAAGTARVGGTLDASAPNGGDGGFIETSAAHVKVAEGAKVTTLAANGLTGSWLIDPTDFTVAASGGDMTGAQVGAALDTNNFSIESSAGSVSGAGGSGNININDAVSWSAANTMLTLTASNDVNVNANISASGASAGLTINPNTANGVQPASGSGSFKLASGASISLPGASARLTIAGSAYELIHDQAALQAVVTGNSAKRYAVANDLELSGTFNSIGANTGTFTGIFDGLGNRISNLVIAEGAKNKVGLFSINGGTIRNVALVDATISGGYAVGALAGDNYGTISASYATGSVSGGEKVGGLVGYNGDAISASYANASVSATGSLSNVGGLVGWNNGNISTSYATGSVSGTSDVGGLVGRNARTVSASYATGSVTGTSEVGGLVGWNEGNISASYATGNVSGTDYVGGLVGDNSGTVSASYAKGSVSGTSYVGGLAGDNRVGMGSVSNSYWNAANGQSVTGAWSNSAGLTTAQMTVAANFAGFSFTTTPGATGNAWFMVDGGTPLLASEYSTAIHNAHQLQLMAMDLSASYTLTANIDAAATATAKDVWGSAGFAPIGAYAAKFTGSFDGQGHSVSGLTINRPTTDYVGLFGATATTSVIRNVGLVNATVSGQWYVGALAGANRGSIANSYASGSVSGTLNVGGLVGLNNYMGTISASYAAVNVSATGDCTGGLVGTNEKIISNSYATGSVNGVTDVGGLVGKNNGGAVIASYWDKETSGPSTSSGSSNSFGLTTSAMKQAASFSGWDTSLWKFYDGLAAPLLRSFLTPLTVTVASGSRAYDGTTATAGLSVTGYSSATNANLLGGVTAITAASKNVGVQALSATGLYSNQQGYDISYAGTLAITAKALTVNGTTVADKIYDGTTTATLIGGTLVGVVSGDTVGLDQSGTFADKNVGTAKAVTASLAGSAAANYTLTQPGALTADITARALTLASASAANKVYDGNTAESVTGTLSGVIGGDAVTFAGSFADKNVGTAKTVTASLTGSGAGNYALTPPAALAADITAKALTVSGTTVADKIYDGNTTATLAGGTLAGVVSGETVGLSQSGAFASPNAGSAIGVTASDSLSGAAAVLANYTLTQPTSLAANITAKALTVNGTTVADKIYDGNTTATLTGGTLAGVVSGETVGLSQSGAFASPNAGSAIGVTASDSLSGAAAVLANYTLTQPTSLAANISAKALTVNGTTVADKTYDGDTTATLSGGTLSGVVGSEAVGFNQSGVFAGKNVGSAIAVTASDSLSGNAAVLANYTLSQPTSLAANITAKALSVSGTTVADKIYDGNTTATLSGGTLVGIVSSDTVGLDQIGVFAGKNVGNTIAVSAMDNLLGNAAVLANYTLTQPTPLSANITARALSVSGTTVADKTYDGNTAATLTGGTLVGVVGSEAVGLNQSGAFASANAGSAIAVTASDSLSGAAAVLANYTLAQPTALTARISTKALTLAGASAANKIYDGNTAASVSGTLSGIVGGDTVTLAGSFADKNIGTAKAVTASLAGSAAGNYTVNGALNADITAKSLSVSHTTVADKVYDGNTGATLTGGTLVGVVAGEAVALNQSGAFASANVGNAIAVTARDSLLGSASVLANYMLTQPAGLAGNIVAPTPAPIPAPTPTPTPVSVAAEGLSALAAGVLLQQDTQYAARASARAAGLPATDTPRNPDALASSAPLLASSPASAQLDGLQLRIVDGGVRLPTAVAIDN